MNRLEQQYEVSITKRALTRIRKMIPTSGKRNGNSTTEYALLIFSQGRIGAGYIIQINSVHKLDGCHYYHPLFPPEYKNHGFAIYIEPFIIRDHYLPNRFVIDLVTHVNGEQVLDIKNPEFEIIDDN